MSDFPDDDSQDLSPEELKSCIIVENMGELAKAMILSCPDCSETLKPSHFERKRLKPDHYIRARFSCSNNHKVSRLFKVNWLETYDER